MNVRTGTRLGETRPTNGHCADSNATRCGGGVALLATQPLRLSEPSPHLHHSHVRRVHRRGQWHLLCVHYKRDLLPPLYRRRNGQLRCAIRRADFASRVNSQRGRICAWSKTQDFCQAASSKEFRVAGCHKPAAGQALLQISLRRHVSSNFRGCLLERFGIDPGSSSPLIIGR